MRAGNVITSGKSSDIKVFVIRWLNYQINKVAFRQKDAFLFNIVEFTKRSKLFRQLSTVVYRYLYITNNTVCD